MLRRQSIGQEGASAEFCDLSGRGLTTAQVERTLRVFDTAVAIDMSNNELEQIPSMIPSELVALDVSFNLLSDAHGLERLKLLQEVHLGFNRLVDVTILEFCPLLQRVNVSGNRLTNTRGLEALARLEHLDLSDNLIEYPEALRSLSMNQHLTHLMIRGNPIAHRATTDCRVLVLDMVPSVLILDDKKIRASTKCKQQPDDQSSSSTAGTTKSLSYSRIYGDKKQFVVRHQQTRRTPATRPTTTLLGDPTVAPKYEGNTIFLQPPKATTITQDLSVPYPTQGSRSPRRLSTSDGGPPMPAGTMAVRMASPTASGGAYMSLYDRIAAAHGISHKPPPAEEVMAAEPPKPQTRRLGSSQSRRNDSKSPSSDPLALQQTVSTRRSIDAGSARPPSRGGIQSRPHTPSTHTTSAPQVGNHAQPPHQTTRPSQNQTMSQASTLPQSSHYVASPSPVPTHNATSMAQPASCASHSLDPKQQNVLSVIQNLIQHKKQTLATLARQSSSSSVSATSVFSS